MYNAIVKFNVDGTFHDKEDCSVPEANTKAHLTPVIKKKRLDFASHHYWTFAEWKKVLFSDECTMYYAFGGINAYNNNLVGRPKQIIQFCKKNKKTSCLVLNIC